MFTTILFAIAAVAVVFGGAFLYALAIALAIHEPEPVHVHRDVPQWQAELQRRRGAA